ncbi:CoA-transferase family III [Amycolatopsis marina]|uniref:CoA-transferase family III n=1 Tax=Amycolatopsis marina TaxID=490629 RepID=A0A1I1B4H0_9PSEU|nr:CoA transferase [Amycolatopsis marina]SFB45244.1 CoA-transferase family III [Amycolatopsis marina]
MTVEFAALWRALTGDRSPEVRFTGPESALPGRYRVTTAAAAVVAATTSAAAELLRLRGIAPGPVAVDTHAAVAGFASERFLRVGGKTPGETWAPLSGNYRASDGWVRLHCNYPHHAEAACRALAVAPERADRPALERAVARLGALQVQESVIAEGGAAAAMRSGAGWLRHPQGDAVARQPLMELSPIAPAPRRRVPESSGTPLGGVRVLELTHVIAGPVAGRTLAAHGADVLHLGAAHLPAVGPLVIDTGMGKRSAFVDLRTAEGRERLWRLVTDADVLVRSFRPGAFDRLGFTLPRLAQASPGLVVVDLSAYGWAGPWAGRRGFDSLVQLACGIAHEDGADAPRPLPVQALDHATGWFAACAAMLGLWRRATEGGSWHARLALAHTARWLDQLGRQPDESVEFDAEHLLRRTESGFGTLTHVPVPGTLPAAPPHWRWGTPKPGSSAPAWW